MTKSLHYADAETGAYIGKIDGAMAVDSAPADPEAVWTGASWRSPMRYWAQDGGPFIRQDEVSPEDGAIGMTSAPDGDDWQAHRLVDGAWVYDADLALQRKRAGAFLTKGDFCRALLSAGLVPVKEAADAVTGAWPATFASALEAMSEAEQGEARISWAEATTVSRDAPLLAALAAHAGIDDGAVDALFGL